MNKPTLEEIDKIRQAGYRPQVVGCLIHNKKILLVYKEEYNLWQLPQGGIDNGEDIDKAIVREMSEELGEEIIKDAKVENVMDFDRIEFPTKNKGTRQIITDEGEEIFMEGKHYYFVPVTTSTDRIDAEKTEFDDHQWLNYDNAARLALGIYQKGKQRMTLKILELLKENKYI